jgi:hypothetical protein
LGTRVRLSFSFPSSAWERTAAKLRFAGCNTGRRDGIYQ